ncbi:Uncharacterised protein [Vibrio cholerae]|nr:Uncharacterised protein [Vibrio cholerae]
MPATCAAPVYCCIRFLVLAMPASLVSVALCTTMPQEFGTFLSRR